VNGFGLKLCMAVATMINGVNNCHKSKDCGAILPVACRSIQSVSQFSNPASFFSKLPICSCTTLFSRKVKNDVGF